MTTVTIGDISYDIKDFRLASAALAAIIKDHFVASCQANFISRIPVHIERLQEADLNIMADATKSLSLEDIHHYFNDLAEHYGLDPIPAYPLTEATIKNVETHDNMVQKANELMDELEALLDLEDTLIAKDQQAALEQAQLDETQPEQAQPEQAQPEQAQPEQAQPEQISGQHANVIIIDDLLSSNDEPRPF